MHTHISIYTHHTFGAGFVALDVFIPPIDPQPQTTTSHLPKILEAEFGDGYTQVSADGLNNNRQTVRLVWTSIKNTHANHICGFFEGLRGATPFLYQLPDEIQPKRWRCTKWDKTYAANNRRMVTAELKQDFGNAQ